MKNGMLHHDTGIKILTPNSAATKFQVKLYLLRPTRIMSKKMWERGLGSGNKPGGI